MARSLRNGQEVELNANESVVLASVFKVAVALEFCRQATTGEVDPAQRVLLKASTRTGGPTGLSICRDDAELSYRDLAYFMMSISDNAATDALIDLVGLDRINQTLRDLELTQTVIPWSGAEALDHAATEFGFENWLQLVRAQAGELGEDAAPRANDLDVVQRSQLLHPQVSMRSTAREIARLIEMIWTDAAGPVSASAEVRWLMSHQPKSRIARCLGDGVRTFAKSGSLWGVVRNEAGVVQLGDGEAYVLSVFTRAREPFARGDEVEAAIGEVSRMAIERLA